MCMLLMVNVMWLLVCIVNFDSLVCVLLVLIDCYNLFILVNIFFICYKNIFFREKLNVYV